MKPEDQAPKEAIVEEVSIIIAVDIPSEVQVDADVKNKDDGSGAEVFKRNFMCIFIAVVLCLYILAFFYKPLERVCNGFTFAGMIICFKNYAMEAFDRSLSISSSENLSSPPSEHLQDTTEAVNSVEKKLDDSLNKFKIIVYPVIAFLVVFSSSYEPLDWLSISFTSIELVGVLVFFMKQLFDVDIIPYQGPTTKIDQGIIDDQTKAKDCKDASTEFDLEKKMDLSFQLVLLFLVLFTAFYEPMEGLNKRLGDIGQVGATVYFIFYFFDEYVLEIFKRLVLLNSKTELTLPS